MRDNRIDLLDHGYVRLVDSMGSDLAIVRAARVSHDADWRTGSDTGSDERLIRYLWQNAHTSPFEAVTLTFEVKAPIFVFRQWHRHRTWSFNEVSARYTELPSEFYIPRAEVVGVQATSNKQGRKPGGNLSDRATETALLRETMQQAFRTYSSLLASGWPRELARSCLPVATYSRMFGTVSLLNLFRFMTLRRHPHAQHEIREYADAMRRLAAGVAPIAVDAWDIAQLKGEEQ